MYSIRNNPVKLYRCLPSCLIIAALICFFSQTCAANEDKEPPKMGNFALPTSQQPGPLVSFGQNLLDKNETQIFLFADDFIGIRKHFIDIIPSVLYGITDNLSLFISVPYAESFKMNQEKSAGFEDASIQLEYTFYSKSTAIFFDQATVVANVTVPTGSIQKHPPTGVGSPSFFLGATFNRTYVDWFMFASPGFLLTTAAKNDTKFGNSYLYQFGFGRNISDSNGWILVWMAEIDGTYTQRNTEQGVINPNSGGNVVYVTPSLWASTKKFIFQFGVGFPVTQHSYGNQTRETYLLTSNIGWSIY